MATRTRTRNLKLVVDSNLSATAKSNLAKIDALASVLQLDNTNNAVIRSSEDIVLRPHDSSIGGDGIGGTVTLGSASQPLTAFIVHASAVSLGNSALLTDLASGGTAKLSLSYNSTLSGTVDPTNRSLTFDLQGASRSLILGGNLTVTATSVISSALTLSAPLTTAGSALSLTMPSSIAWTLPSAAGTNGQVLTNNGSEVLSWSTVSGAGTFNASYDWTTADGPTKSITHGQNTRNMIVQVTDSADNYANVDVRITRPTVNTVVLEASEAPSSSWRVLLYQTT